LYSIGLVTFNVLFSLLAVATCVVCWEYFMQHLMIYSTFFLLETVADEMHLMMFMFGYVAFTFSPVRWDLFEIVVFWL